MSRGWGEGGRGESRELSIMRRPAKNRIKNYIFGSYMLLFWVFNDLMIIKHHIVNSDITVRVYDESGNVMKFYVKTFFNALNLWL